LRSRELAEEVGGRGAIRRSRLNGLIVDGDGLVDIVLEPPSDLRLDVVGDWRDDASGCPAILWFAS
jgi:hypothetical protein